MPKYQPEEFWKGEDVYIIGGGTSLNNFNWELLRHRNTIGCNGAFGLGVDICKILIFGDLKFWENFKDRIKKEYGGIVVTNARELHDNEQPYLYTMKREPCGLHYDALGWNGNTGASAINLALLLGAEKVFLLGFDMKLGIEGKANWHDTRYEKEKAEVYDRFLKGYDDVYYDWKTKFENRYIINITNDSDLEVFPKITLEKHFRGEKIYV